MKALLVIYVYILLMCFLTDWVVFCLMFDCFFSVECLHSCKTIYFHPICAWLEIHSYYGCSHSFIFVAARFSINYIYTNYRLSSAWTFGLLPVLCWSTWCHCKWLPTYLLVCVWKSFWCVWAEGITPRHSLLGSREHILIFHWHCPIQNTNLHSHWEHMRIPIVPCTHQHLKSLGFYTFISLMIFKWHFSNKLILFLFLLMCQTTLYTLPPFFRTFLVKYPFLTNIYWVPVCMCAC